MLVGCWCGQDAWLQDVTLCHSQLASRVHAVMMHSRLDLGSRRSQRWNMIVLPLMLRASASGERRETSNTLHPSAQSVFFRVGNMVNHHSNDITLDW